MLTLENIDMGYGDTKILWDVSLNVKKGEIVALIGSNGAGKTTLMYTVSGLYAPWKGRIRWEGNDITKTRAHERIHYGLALVPQGRRLFPSMTVEQNLHMGALHRKFKQQDLAKELNHVYDLFPRLQEREKQLAGKLSGGEQQMLAIGRALMANPKMLLIDEMSLGLAPVLVDNIIISLKEIAKEGITVFLVEQDVEIALEISQRAYVLEHGKIALEGSSAWLYDHPQVKEAYLGM